jgi:hypothetical protein
MVVNPQDEVLVVQVSPLFKASLPLLSVSDPDSLIPDPAF